MSPQALLLPERYHYPNLETIALLPFSFGEKHKASISGNVTTWSIVSTRVLCEFTMLKSWLNFLPDKGFHWSRATMKPADNSSTWCSFSFSLLFECRSGLLQTRKNTRRSSAAFGLGCEPTMTNICCLIGLVNTLCSGRKYKRSRLFGINTLVIFQSSLD